MSSYLIKRTDKAPVPGDDFVHSEIWKNVESIELNYKIGKMISCFPKVRLKLLYDNTYIYGRYFVKDNSIYLNTTDDMQMVCFDTCVEIFLQPKGNTRYYNFEFSGNGNMLVYNVTHCRSGNFTCIDKEDIQSIIRVSTLPKRVVPEYKNKKNWQFFFAIPIQFFVKYGDNVNPNLAGQTWRGNVTKCGDHCTPAHYVSWQPLPKLDFHLPECFGEFTFEA